jgi:UDP-N-acetylmuramoyl-L-alanyl-D-glutamate--2,6-diaminopimelate ligase
VTGLAGARLVSGDPATVIGGVGLDWRCPGPGTVFVAAPGGERFASEAVARGAVAVVAGDPGAVEVPAGVPVVGMMRADSAPAYLAGDVAAALYGDPSRVMTVVGVTGTAGKTTTVRLIAAALEASGVRSGCLTGPLGRAGGVHRALAGLALDGCGAAAVEASSVALAADELRGCSAAAAVLTNLSPDRLEAHGSMEAYLAAKASLFTLVGDGGLGVLNADSPVAPLFARYCRGRVLTFGVRARADVRARAIRIDGGGAAFTVDTPWGSAEVATPLAGAMNVANWLAAAAVVLGLGADLADVVAAARSTTVPGRMERIECGQDFGVVVDAARTPSALAAALRAVRDQTRGRLLVGFGHGGGLEAGNRPALGSVAASLADVTVLTADDPGGEDPGAIAAQILTGAACESRPLAGRLVVELDRAAAIRRLVAMAAPGDTVLVAGKGDSARQVLGSGPQPWSDAAQARGALAELGYRQHVA